jgi:NADPH:quinone reductase-like Zn-dependent oxidoreductase
MGPIVVTGATGGVGSLAIDMLTSAGYEAHAISGKLEHFDDSSRLGAKQCISRKDLYWGQRPLETSRWAGAIDNVGGDMLAGLTRVVHPYGTSRAAATRPASTCKRRSCPSSSAASACSASPSAGTAREIRDAVWHALGDRLASGASGPDHDARGRARTSCRQFSTRCWRATRFGGLSSSSEAGRNSFESR